MAEAERTIGTPDTPEASGPEPEHPQARKRSEEPQRPEADAPPSEPGTDGQAAGSGTGVRQATEAADGARRSGRQRKVIVLFAVAAASYALDLVSKVLVVARLEHHPPIHLIGDVLRLDAIRNPGAAFGMGGAYTVIFTLIAAAVIFVIVRLARKLYSIPWAVALGLLLGGALGNLTDRLFRSPGVFQGAVVDFIAPEHFAVFNLADSAIVCGGILIVLLSFRGLDPDGSVHAE